MKKIIFFILIFGFSIKAYADEDWAIEKPDGTLAILHYFGGSKPLEQVLIDQGLDKYIRHKIDVKNLPAQEDRKYWYFENSDKKVEIDEVTKGKDLADKNNAEKRRKDLIAKTGLKEDEFKELIDMENKNV